MPRISPVFYPTRFFVCHFSPDARAAIAAFLRSFREMPEWRLITLSSIVLFRFAQRVRAINYCERLAEPSVQSAPQSPLARFKSLAKSLIRAAPERQHTPPKSVFPAEFWRAHSMLQFYQWQLC